MEKRTILSIAVFLLVILGIAIIYFGMSGPKIMWPPVITGVGFFCDQLGFLKIKRKLAAQYNQGYYDV